MVFAGHVAITQLEPERVSLASATVEDLEYVFILQIDISEDNGAIDNLELTVYNAGDEEVTIDVHLALKLGQTTIFAETSDPVMIDEDGSTEAVEFEFYVELDTINTVEITVREA